MAEWLNAAVSKTVIPGNWYRGFKSLSFRYLIYLIKKNIVSIFNIEKKRDDSKPNIVLEDYERKIEERKEEYQHLNKILLGMRTEVSDLMEEIKKLSDEIVKKNAEKFLVEQKLDDLDHSYRLLLQDIEYKQNILLSLNNNIEKIKTEINADLSIQIETTKIEEEKVLPQNAKEQFPGLELTQGTKKKIKSCSAKTKEGIRCKRAAVENSKFCSIHLKK